MALTKKQLGARIKAQRIAKKKTQYQLAKDCKVKQPTISIWESGSPPGYDGLCKLAKALGMTVSSLMMD